MEVGVIKITIVGLPTHWESDQRGRNICPRELALVMFGDVSVECPGGNDHRGNVRMPLDNLYLSLVVHDGAVVVWESCVQFLWLLYVEL